MKVFAEKILILFLFLTGSLTIAADINKIRSDLLRLENELSKLSLVSTESQNNSISEIDLIKLKTKISQLKAELAQQDLQNVKSARNAAQRKNEENQLLLERDRLTQNIARKKNELERLSELAIAEDNKTKQLKLEVEGRRNELTGAETNFQTFRDQNLALRAQLQESQKNFISEKKLISEKIQKIKSDRIVLETEITKLNAISELEKANLKKVLAEEELQTIKTEKVKARYDTIKANYEEQSAQRESAMLTAQDKSKSQREVEINFKEKTNQIRQRRIEIKRSCRLRDAPKDDAQTSIQYIIGDTVVVSDFNSEWLQAYPDNQKNGFIKANCFELQQRSSASEVYLPKKAGK